MHLLRCILKKLHPGDLKSGIIKTINDILGPVQRHFQENPEVTTSG